MRECERIFNTRIKTTEGLGGLQPEKVLLVFLLRIAIKDLQNTELLKAHRDTTRYWFQSTEEDGERGFTFLDVCTYLDLKPSWILKELDLNGLLDYDERWLQEKNAYLDRKKILLD